MKQIGIVLGLLIVLVGVWVEGASAQEPFTFEPTECMFTGIEAGAMSMSADMLGFECGYVTVPEEHANPDGATIRIPVAILRATGSNPQPDPLFLAQGRSWR